MSTRTEVEIEDLLLDHENPRLGSVESQPEALRELIELSPRYFETMMQSIKENGLDPGDLFYLVDECGGSYMCRNNGHKSAATKHN